MQSIIVRMKDLIKKTIKKKVRKDGKENHEGRPGRNERKEL